MVHSVNCKANDQGAWCKDRRIKRSIWGIGARVCLVFEGKACPYQDKYPRPPVPRTPQCAYQGAE